jgi:DUF3011 family protein
VSHGRLRSITCGFSFQSRQKKTFFQSIGRRAKFVMSTGLLASRLTAQTDDRWWQPRDLGLSVKTQRLAWIAGLFIALCIPSLSFAQRISCESRDYQRNYCATGIQVTKAWLINQRSKSPCIQNRSWGYDDGGIWVNSGCAGEFGFRGGRPVGNTIVCESRDYRRNYCGAGGRVSRAWVVEQRSQSPCIQGRSWGYDDGGVWVDSGCSAAFAYQRGGGPPQTNRVRCESRNYERNFCEVRAQVLRVWLVEQESDAACIEGQTWGSRGNGIWVNHGCTGVFAFDRR